MKIRFTTLLILLITCIHTNSRTVSKSIRFEEQIFNFGEIYENKGRVSHTFTFLNSSSLPIIIEKIATGCGCTTYSYTKEPIKKGHKGKIIVSFDPEYRQGFFSKEITVFSSDHSISRVWIKGSVMPAIHPVEEDYPYSWGYGLYTSLKVLAFGEIANGKNKQIKLRYANDTKKPMAFNFVLEGDNQNLKFSNPGLIPPMKRGEMIVTYTMSKTKRGEKSIRIYPIVNGKRLSKYILAKATCI
ncbi:MAG: hypothetical protein H6Q12_791 [Bacteroidetes bacterium]|nr:hypothetical protein [Bacteroidota bacterium]